MAPRLGRTEVEAIFGRNLFAEHDNRSGFEDIVGLGVHKPFECVGEYYEAAESMLGGARRRRVARTCRWSRQFRTRRAELEAVATAPDAVRPAVDYVPARYAATLAFAELPG